MEGREQQLRPLLSKTAQVSSGSPVPWGWGVNASPIITRVPPEKRF